MHRFLRRGPERNRFGLMAGALLLLGLWVSVAQANWTGIEVSLVNTDSDWDFDGEMREA